MAGKEMAVSPLALPMPEVPPVAGVRLGVVEAGIRYDGRADLTMIGIRPGHHGGRRLHPQQMPRRAGRLVPRRR